LKQDKITRLATKFQKYNVKHNITNCSGHVPQHSKEHRFQMQIEVVVRNTLQLFPSNYPITYVEIILVVAMFKQKASESQQFLEMMLYGQL